MLLSKLCHHLSTITIIHDLSTNTLSSSSSSPRPSSLQHHNQRHLFTYPSFIHLFTITRWVPSVLRPRALDDAPNCVPSWNMQYVLWMIVMRMMRMMMMRRIGTVYCRLSMTLSAIQWQFATTCGSPPHSPHSFTGRSRVDGRNTGVDYVVC